jgi:ubiquinone biosynthesis monooxygenase Coq7
MAAQEQRHLDAFDKMIVDRHVRPTALHPLWHVAGYALGAATALLGREAAMACTVAVEEVIDEHYAKQAAQLGDEERDLKALIEDFRAEEIEHRDLGLAEGAERAPAYDVLKGTIKAGSRVAIWLAERF